MKLFTLFNFAISLNFYTGDMIKSDVEPLKISISVIMGSRAHARYLLELSEVLISRGHHVSYLCSKDTSRYSIGYNVTNSVVSHVQHSSKTLMYQPFTRNSRPFDFSGRPGKQLTEIYADSFPNYEKIYKEKRPDLVICDFFSLSCIDSAVKYSIPMIIGYQSLNFEEKKPYLTIKENLDPTTIENYTFWERFSRAIIHPIANKIKLNEFLSDLKRVRKANGVPGPLEFSQFTNMGLRIANSFIGFENPRSLSSNVYPIGPILTENLPSLSSDLQSFFDSHKKILYIAFGSYIKFKRELSANLLENFQKLLNQGWIDGIIWGSVANINLEEFPKSYTVDNIEYSTESILNGSHQSFKLLKWAPQEAILNHPHTKIFITHGGLDSIQESIQSGTPMLAIPHDGDQPRNSRRIKEVGIGDYIEWPLDGDDLINQKFVNLLDPTNLILKAKIEQLQRISKLNSNRKIFAADLIETYAYTAKSCRAYDSPNSFEIPCEVKTFLPLNEQISFIKANLIDVYSVATLLIIVITGFISLIVLRVFYKAWISYRKQKKE